MKKFLRLALILAVMLSLMAGITVSVSAEGEYTYIEDASVTGTPIPELQVGDTLPELSYSVPEGANYTVTEAAWYKNSSSAAAGTVVEDGNEYQLCIEVTANEGYAFAVGYSLLINGEAYSFMPVNSLGEGFEIMSYDRDYAFLTPIDKVELNHAEPVLGQVLPSATVPAGANYSVESDWHDNNNDDDPWLEEGAVAAKTGWYVLNMTAYPAEGYMFTEETQVWINGVPLVDYTPSAHDYMNVWSGNYNFGDPVARVELSYAEPVLGQALPTPTVSGEGVALEWYWYETVTDERMTEGAVAEKGCRYELNCNINAAAGYKITEDTKFYVNGEQLILGEDVGYNGTFLSYCSDYYSFLDKLSAVSFTLAAPAVGQPFPEAVVPTSANYEVYTEWHNIHNGENAFGNVQDGVRYEARVNVLPLAGYEFAEGLTFTVNGSLVSNGEYYFETSELIFSRQYTFADPVAKVALPALPNLKVGDTLPESSGTGNGYAYVIAAMGFDADGNPIDSNTVVDGGMYMVAVVAQPAAGYEFTDDTVFTVGGKAPSIFAQRSLTQFADYKVFNFGEGETVDEIQINTNIPCIGQSKGGQINFTNQTGYTVDMAIWGVASDATLRDANDLTKPLQAGQHVLMGLDLYTEEGYIFSSNLKIYVNGKEYVPVLVQGDLGSLYIILDLGEAQEGPKYNGLTNVDGVWGYYEGGVLQTEYTGLVPYGDILFYVENGILDFTYTGLVWHNDAWRYVANSQLTEGYTGLVWFNDNWFYTVDSVIDWTFTGLVPYEGNYFYVQNNLLDWSYTGLGYHDGGWYFIQNGLLQKEYSGLVYFNDNWFYVEEGVLTYQYFGMVEYQGNLFYVQASHLDWNYTGLGYHEGAWYYFQNALYTPTFSGLVPFNGSLFYVKDGTIDWSFNGEAEYDGTIYTVVNGAVQQ